MAFSKHLASYPPAMIELFQQAITAEGPFAIPCEDRREANRLRLCLYQIKYATMHTKDHPLQQRAAAKQMSITRNNEVLFRSPEDSPLQAWAEKLLAATSQGE